MWQLRKLQLNARLRQPNARCLAQGNSPRRVAVLLSVEVGFTPKSLHQSAQLRKSKSRSQPTAEMSAKLLSADWSPREVSGFYSVVRHEQRLQMWTATPNTGLPATHSRTQVSATLTVEHRTGISIPTWLTGTKLVVSGSMSDTPPRKTKCWVRQHCSENP